jgi:hypothetical protein
MQEAAAQGDTDAIAWMLAHYPVAPVQATGPNKSI